MVQTESLAGWYKIHPSQRVLRQVHFATHPAMRMPTNWLTMQGNAAGEAMEKQLYVPVSYFQGSAMSATGDWTDRLCCL